MVEQEHWLCELLDAIAAHEETHSGGLDGQQCIAHIKALIPVDEMVYARAYMHGYRNRPTELREYPACVHRPNAMIINVTPCGKCASEKRKGE